MERILVVIGASIFGILGTIHLVYTFFTTKFDSRDPDVTRAMKVASPVLTSETTMWNAWIGFNASHSLGAMIFALVYLVLATHYEDVVFQSMVLTLLPFVVGLSYSVLAKLFWFKIPFIGIAVATLCFMLAIFLVYV